MKTLYDLLGALPDDDAESIRAAFRKAAQANHPDRNPGDPEAPQRFRRIVRANAILSDERQRATYDRLLEIALEAGAEELTTEEDQYVITTSHDQLYAVAEALKKAGVTTDGQKFTFIPDTTVTVSDETVARQVLRLCDALEEDDDVQNVYSNLDIPDELLARLPA